MAQDMNALAPVSSLPDKDEWGTIFGMAQQLVPTGFLPKAVDTPQKAAAIMLKGRELGIPPMYALSNITVIQGKPTANAELMLALVKRAYGRNAIWMEESTPQVARIGYLVHGKPKFYEFNMDMAKKAGLLSNQTWTKYPDAMLRARAISAVCRMEFPEVVGGMYVPGGLGEEVSVDESTGEVVSVEYTPKATATVEEPIAYNEAEFWNKQLRRLHAVAAEQGITHDDSHLWALDRGKESVKDFTTDAISSMASSIEASPEKAQAYFTELREPKPDPEEVDPDTGEFIPAVIGQGELIDMPTHSGNGPM